MRINSLFSILLVKELSPREVEKVLKIMYLIQPGIKPKTSNPLLRGNEQGKICPLCVCTQVRQEVGITMLLRLRPFRTDMPTSYGSPSMRIILYSSVKKTAQRVVSAPIEFDHAIAYL